MTKQCTHQDQIRDVTPSGNGCKECLALGDTWRWCYVDQIYLTSDASDQRQGGRP